MNFLAHLYLSGNDESIMVGNFIADVVKGKKALGLFEEPVKRGIELHRVIDFFTDNHPVVTQSKDRLRLKYRHYAGVIVDMVYDHCLARNWNSYTTEPLPVFAARAYGILQQHTAILPD